MFISLHHPHLFISKFPTWHCNRYPNLSSDSLFACVIRPQRRLLRSRNGWNPLHIQRKIIAKFYYYIDSCEHSQGTFQRLGSRRYQWILHSSARWFKSPQCATCVLGCLAGFKSVTGSTQRNMVSGSGITPPVRPMDVPVWFRMCYSTLGIFLYQAWGKQ